MSLEPISLESVGNDWLEVMVQAGGRRENQRVEQQQGRRREGGEGQPSVMSPDCKTRDIVVNTGCTAVTGHPTKTLQNPPKS